VLVQAGGSSPSSEPGTGGGSDQHWLSTAFGELDKVQSSDNSCSFAGPFTEE